MSPLVKPLPKFSRSLRVAVLVAGVIGVVTGVMAWFQVERERQIDLEDIDRRAHAIAHQLSFAIGDALELADEDVARVLGSRLEGYRRLIGCAVYRPQGQVVASSKAATEFADVLKVPVGAVLEGVDEAVEMSESHGPSVHILAVRLFNEEGNTQGILAVIHDISYIQDRASSRLIHFAYWILVLAILAVTLFVGITWAAYDRPLKNLAEWMRRLRTDDAPESPPPGLPVALLASETERLAASFRAARSTGWETSREAVHEHNVWSRERLRAHAIDCLHGGQLVVVSNREPYMHELRDGKPHLLVPAGGLVTALDPVLQACGGLWVAHGAGDADRQTADSHGRITVPPRSARYTLRRVWLTREEEQGYYYGLSNEGFWPLCHLAHERPVFRASDWKHYVTANQRFADTVLDEIGSADATVFVQDYQLALVPRMLKAVRPEIRVGIFWHIPWPNPEAFRICPWRAELLKGMLGADLIGFHLQQYCNNFLDTVDRMVEARLDWDDFAVELRGHRSLIRPFPISIESWAEKDVHTGAELVRRIEGLKDQYNLAGVQIAVGVDRIDYTKGLPERFRAVARFLEKYPQYRERFTFVQLGAPSRTHLRRYREHLAELEALADEINWKFQTDHWKPIRFLIAHHNAATVHAFLKMASVCIVSSLHDGMNLVAKEYVAAQENEGILILSEFAGAARELSDALIINPYDTEQFADAIRYAVEMEPAERVARMSRMRRQVEEFNVYRWAAHFLTELGATKSAQERSSNRSGMERQSTAEHVRRNAE